jgi:predicted dehydrogenase
MDKIKVIVIGCGNMGCSHARAYNQIEGFELCGLVDRDPDHLKKLAEELGEPPTFADTEEAIDVCKPDAAAICTYPDSHYTIAKNCLNRGLHLFVEKPLAETVEEAEEIIALAEKSNKKITVGYILHHHPSWQQFTDIARTLGKPLVMRMNLNQQSKGKEWQTHKRLLRSMSPIVDCGVHYVDIMCRMTGSRPVRVQAIGARLSDEIDKHMYNWGQLQVVFADGSVGWYEAGWGPMISETAYFVKDVIGPKGCVSIVDPTTQKADADSSDIDSHTGTGSLIQHDAGLDEHGNFIKRDIVIDTSQEPGHQELCDREQQYFLKVIRENIDQKEHLQSAVNSLRIVLAADESIRTGQTVLLRTNS